MFKIDRFSPDGLILVNDNEEGRSDESMADHNIDDFHMPTFVDQFAVPSEILLPLKNNTEKELLLRFADLAAQIDHHIDIFTSSYQNWFTQSNLDSPLRQASTFFEVSQKENQYQNIPDSGLAHIFSPVASHQLPSTSTPAGDVIHPQQNLKDLIEELANLLLNLNKLREKIGDIHGMNLTFVEELASKCPEVAAQKQSLANMEALILERLRKLFDEKNPFHASLTRWESLLQITHDP